MKIEQRTREIIGTVFGGFVVLVLTALLFAVAITGYWGSTVELGKVDKFEGRIVERRIVLKKDRVNLNVFYFKLEGLSDRLASYNIKQDYRKLTDSLNINDKITVYFKKSKSQRLNLDVIQIEKNGQIILDKSEFETKESSLIFVGAIGGTLMLGLFAGMIIQARKVLITKEMKQASTFGQSN